MKSEKAAERYTPDMTPEEVEALDKKLANRSYRALLRKARPNIESKDLKRIRKGFVYAFEAHKEMRRKSGEPYILHPLEVAKISVGMGLGTTSIIAALLHDVVEDTDTTCEDIEREFGPRVRLIVEGLTKVPDILQPDQSRQAETFKRLLLTISEDIRVVLIKIADRLHNMRTLESMPKEKQLKIKAETEFIYAPLAHRLGLYNIKTELEDLSLKYSNRAVYDMISSKMAKSRTSRNKFIQNFVKPVERELERQGFDFEIKSRTKAIASIWSKMQRQNVPFEEVYDLFAIRVILNTAPGEDEKFTCWKVYSVITDFYQPNTNRLRDWISIPKSNGYESLHTTVMFRDQTPTGKKKRGQWVEVQIRTRRMDEIAEKGYAAHWKYKGASADKAEQGIEQWIAKVRELLENKSANAMEFVDDFAGSFFSDEIYVFTPKGELRVLPSGSTILDFAYDIHSEIGNRCLGGKVNHKLVSLSQVLQNGDQVEILKSSQPKVNNDWLKVAQTSKARSKIRGYLRRDRKNVMDAGKEIVLRKLKQLKMTLNDKTLTQMMDYFGEKVAQDFYFKVGNREIDHTELKKFKDAAKRNENLPQTAKEFKKARKEKGDSQLVIGGDMDIEYSLSKCCNPIPGDDIFGIITVARGIRIHRADCPNAVAIMASYGDRIIKARWAEDDRQHYEIRLDIVGTDRKGIIQDVSKVVLQQNNVSMTSINFSTDHGIFEGKITLSVVDRHQVDHILEEMRKVDGVVNVSRHEDN